VKRVIFANVKHLFLYSQNKFAFFEKTAYQITRIKKN